MNILFFFGGGGFEFEAFLLSLLAGVSIKHLLGAALTFLIFSDTGSFVLNPEFMY